VTTLLIDADVLVYRFAHSEQVVVRWHRDLFTMHAELEPAKAHIEDFINEMLEKTGCDQAVLVLSDLDRNYRKELPHVTYKANRAGLVRPMLWKPLREWFLEEWGAHWEPSLEGDDMLGLLHRGAPGFTLGIDVDSIIATIDKDLRTVPGRHYNWDHSEYGVYDVTPEEAQEFFLTQVLTGDKTDGYGGVPGIGPVKAAKVLGLSRSDPWGAIVRCFEKAGLSAEVALDMARCAWVLRGDDYDFAAKEVRLWSPDRLLPL
jgi:DNA polymerase-1